MQLTPNYKLKKPEGADPVDILDLNDNADIIDAEFKKRPVASGGDVSEMTVKTLEATTTEFPVPVAGESTKTFLGKVKKFFEDTKNWMTGVCLIGQIVNNCVTNNEKLPLSAAQGKVLMDLYTVLNTKITNRFTLLKQGITAVGDYRMGDNISNYDIIIVSLSYYQFSTNTGIRTGAEFVMAQDIPSESDGQATLNYKVISSQTGARYGAYIGLRRLSDTELRITEINADSIKAIKDISIFGLVTK